MCTLLCSDGALRVTEFTRLVPWHELTPAGPIPSACDPDGVYPYVSFSHTSPRPTLRRLRYIALENGTLRAEICPDLGGKVTALFVRARGGGGGGAAGEGAPWVNALSSPAGVRPVRILPRNAFMGGGIEVSFPISHTPSLLERVCCDVALEGGRAYVTVGERELRFGLQWSVEFSLAPGDAFLTQRARFANDTARAAPYMTWSNAGVPAAADTRFFFPEGRVLRHASALREIDWAAEGPRTQGDVTEMSGFFWRSPPRGGVFGVFTPSLGCGLYHGADPAAVPGVKLWSDGVGAHEKWVSQYMTHGREQLLEVQAGPLADQSVKAELAPGAEAGHVEFWWPAAEPFDVAALALPAPALRAAPPLFGWARPEALAPWRALAAAAAAADAAALPPAPDATSFCWPPSGDGALGAPLEWACAAARAGSERDAWALHLGAWRAGRGDVEGALAALAASGDDRARVLRARLLRRERRDGAAAAACFRGGLACAALAAHPQVVVERDLALACAGRAALAERRAALDAVAALSDEAVVERRAALLAAEGKWAEARALLLGTQWQLVHQRYARTRLWRRVAAALGEDPAAPTPANFLGEDSLFEFGAYREYGEDEEGGGGEGAAADAARKGEGASAQMEPAAIPHLLIK
jgi:hypothetical protein